VSKILFCLSMFFFATSAFADTLGPQPAPSPGIGPSVLASPLPTLENSPLATAAPPGEVGFWGKEWYFAWGYNSDMWAPTDIHVSQPALGNDFTIHNVTASDYAQWDTGAFIFDKDPTVPQFNLRVGHFINAAQDLGIELSIDHTKYNTTPDQSALVTGTVNGQAINSYETLTDTYFRYYLHNGVNHIMLSVIKRESLVGDLNKTFNLSYLLKGGLGIILPHADNCVMGNTVDVGPKTFSNFVGYNTGWWQLNGWTVGIEAALRFVIIDPLFIEFADKFAYAGLGHVPVYDGTADHSLWMNEMLVDLGISLHPKY